MRAIQVSRYGGPEVLELVDVPDPVAGSGQAVVDVSVADVLFVDVSIRAGKARDWFEMELPYLAGNGVGGTVASVGEGVDASWVGRRAIARLNGLGELPGGGYVSRALVSADALIEVPDGLGVAEAVTVLHDGTTALLAIRTAVIKPGDWVLVNAAGGSLGSMLVPMAKAAGARVIGAARGERKLARVREWGADVTVDYTEPGWGDRVLAATQGHGVDVVFDGAGGEQGQTAYGLTAPGGRFLAYGASSGGFVEPGTDDRGIELVGIMDMNGGADAAAVLQAMKGLLADAAAGRFKLFVGQTFPLENAAAAHAAIEARETVGKTLLLVD